MSKATIIFVISKLVGAVDRKTTAVDIEAKKKVIEVVKMARGSMSQRAFAKLLGVSATAVQLWEKGDNIPDIGNLVKIAAKAGYTMEELLNYLDAKPLPQTSDLNEIIKQIKSMPLSEVATIAQAAVARLAAAAESSGEQAQVS